MALTLGNMAERVHHLLFLCVANSARSQMAEGIARALAPPGVVVSSAGSDPTAVRPEAVAVLREIGIDISGARSKSVEQIAADSVEIAITLCNEEVCPVFLDPGERLHWPIPDPAAVPGNDQQRMNAFRAARDEIKRRIEELFAKRKDKWLESIST